MTGANEHKWMQPSAEVQQLPVPANRQAAGFGEQPRGGAETDIRARELCLKRSSCDPLVRNIIQLGKPETGSFSTLLGSAKDPNGPRRTQKDQKGPSKARKLRQTGQAALAASSFSSWFFPKKRKKK